MQKSEMFQYCFSNAKKNPLKLYSNKGFLKNICTPGGTTERYFQYFQILLSNITFILIIRYKDNIYFDLKKY